MKPDMILQSDMLDILFEGRNKDYGAYSLRKDYNGRLLKALGAMLLLVLLFIGGYYWAGRMEQGAVFMPPSEKTAVILKVIPPRPEELKPLPPQPKKSGYDQKHGAGHCTGKPKGRSAATY
ncbi:hypothetical protein [Paraflavitalea speifideaquila]|uniref:hypothetical protein n=1 Tax=Paraflavitalea speifideaquila TaxID=3076558 RepID=UPI0028EAF396|nr:hypothetical protein [Paraflavitalea speifideiaquila]